MMDKYYDEIADGYSELHGEEQLKKAKLITSILMPKKSDKLLDVGCGDGACLEVFGCSATGIDPSVALISRYKGDFRVFEGSAEHLPFKNNEFDIVVSITALQNFTDVEKGLLEMKRVGNKKFAFSTLKRSPKLKWISHYIKEHFTIVEVIEEEKDIIYICTV